MFAKKLSAVLSLMETPFGSPELNRGLVSIHDLRPSPTGFLSSKNVCTTLDAAGGDTAGRAAPVLPVGVGDGEVINGTLDGTGASEVFSCGAPMVVA